MRPLALLCSDDAAALRVRALPETCEASANSKRAPPCSSCILGIGVAELTRQQPQLGYHRCHCMLRHGISCKCNSIQAAAQPRQLSANSRLSNTPMADTPMADNALAVLAIAQELHGLYFKVRYARRTSGDVGVWPRCRKPFIQMPCSLPQTTQPTTTIAPRQITVTTDNVPPTTSNARI